MNENQIEIANRLRELVVESLRLDMAPEDITYDMAIYNDGLGLDSVDGLEFIAAIDNEYGISLTSEHRKYFDNMETLSAYLQKRLEENE